VLACWGWALWCPGAPSSLWVPTPCCIAGVVVLMLTASFGLGRLFVVSHRLATLKRCRLRRGHRWQLVSRRDEAILSGCPAAEVERRGIGRLELREILLEGLMDMGTCALHDRLKPAESHLDQFPNTGLSIRPFVDHREPLRLVRAQR